MLKPLAETDLLRKQFNCKLTNVRRTGSESRIQSTKLSKTRVLKYYIELCVMNIRKTHALREFS